MPSFVISSIFLAGVYAYAVIGLAGALNDIREGDREYDFVEGRLRRLVDYRSARILALIVAPLVFVTSLVVLLLMLAITELPDSVRDAADTFRRVLRK